MTSGLRLDFQWESADVVPTPELAATWARIHLFIDDDCLSLVEDQISGEVRTWLDAPTYPLAEWIALNWWFLTSPARYDLHSLRASQGFGAATPAASYREVALQRHNLHSAGSGFPWPRLLLLPERSCFLASLTPMTDVLQRVKFLGSGSYVLEYDSTVLSLSKFVDSTVRRLEDAGIEATPLQDEWQAIQDSSPSEIEFCTASATLGFDPYSIDKLLAKRIVVASQTTDDPKLFVELLESINPSQLDSASQWLQAALAQVPSINVKTLSSSPALLREEISRSEGLQVLAVRPPEPWVTGYMRAGRVRELLNLRPRQDAHIDQLVAVTEVEAESPTRIDALGATVNASPVTVLNPVRGKASQHFTQARALSRFLFEDAPEHFIVSQGHHVRNQVERAFAAELLAPAQGIEERLNGDFSEASRQRAARAFGVGTIVIDHQLENQLLLSSLW